MQENFLLKEAMDGKDEFSRILAQARVRLGYVGFDNMTNKELLLLSHYTRSFLLTKGDRARQAVESCFFHITGYYTHQLVKKGNEGAEFSQKVKEFVKILRKKFNENNDHIE